MKKLIVILFVILSLSSFSQKNLEFKDVPTAVTNKLTTLYPKVSDEEWGSVNATNYECEFVENGIATSVLFDNKGNVLETYVAIKQTDLPSQANDYIDKKYAWKKFRMGEKVTDGRGKVTFRVAVGVDEVKLIFDYQGNFIRIANKS